IVRNSSFVTARRLLTSSSSSTARMPRPPPKANPALRKIENNSPLVTRVPLCRLSSSLFKLLSTIRELNTLESWTRRTHGSRVEDICGRVPPLFAQSLRGKKFRTLGQQLRFACLNEQHGESIEFCFTVL